MEEYGREVQEVAEAPGRRFWRGLEEWACSDEAAALIAREFPDHADEWHDPVSRRRFLSLMGASFALAGVAGCSPSPAPAERIVPYSRQPDGLTPGVPLSFATATSLRGLTTGVLVRSNEGRPTKVEGNPGHPASLGATDVFSQASILGLHDPDRSQTATRRGRASTWEEGIADLRRRLEQTQSTQAAGVRILTETVTSPTMAAQLGALLQRFPQARWIQYEPAGSDSMRDGGRIAFGEEVNVLHDFAKAEVVLALGADFLSCRPETLRGIREFSARRKVRTIGDSGRPQMTRLYAVECMLTLTGAMADHRLPMKNAEIGGFARALSKELGVTTTSAGPRISEQPRRWLQAVVRDLEQHRGSSLVIAGEEQPAEVHALAHAINSHLGNIGQTVHFTDPVAARPANQRTEFSELVEEMRSGKVQILIVVGGNPVYTAPADLDFSGAITKVPFRFHLGLYHDETAAMCDWHTPAAHDLEAWGDGRASDGTVTILQPLIAPLYGGHSAWELLAAMTGQAEQQGREIVRSYWRTVWERGDKSIDFSSYWQQAVRDGVVLNSALPHKEVTLRTDWETGLRAIDEQQAGLEINFVPDPTVFDGRFSNNGWLQELPKPITKLTWDNAALVSPRTARELGVSVQPGSSNPVAATGGEHGRANVEVVELRYRGRTLRAPLWIVPGHADGAVTIHLGYGRERAGRVGDGAGVNAYRLRTSDAPWFGSGLEIHPTGERDQLACTQMHHGMEGREPVRRGTLAKFQKQPTFAQEPPAGKSEWDETRKLIPGPHENEQSPPGDPRLTPMSLYPETPREGHRWAMAIDLTVCTGCSACVVACQAENNIPVVGKEEVTRGREMHWIRIDRYHEGDPFERPEELKTHFQPVPCMHCEKAPCELVCPVAATVHSADGLNDMVYNRCVGTRYCSNNCPYKVRRFNFLEYADFTTPSLRQMYNPEVTVRSRGVMEKCTYCVQRIRQGEIQAEREQRSIVDGDIQTACQQSCPAQAIVFGDLSDKASRVNEWKSQPLNYALLGELNTQPRTTYLAALSHPNPELEGD